MSFSFRLVSDQVLFAVSKTLEKGDPKLGVITLKTEYAADYWPRRQKLIALAAFVALKTKRTRPEESTAAHELAKHVIAGGLGIHPDKETIRAYARADREERRTKANLRAAALDLYEALKDLVERERAEAADCGFTDDEMTWLEDARRALANATGE
jgi:hypothetical protein